jgi:hypothetical protein
MSDLDARIRRLERRTQHLPVRWAGGASAPAPVTPAYPWVQMLVKGGNRLLTGPPIIYGIKRKVGQTLPTGWIFLPRRATATCALGSGGNAGKVVSTTLTNIGQGYLIPTAGPPVIAAPTVTVSAPPSGGTQAVITAAVTDNGPVEGAWITNCGTLYNTVVTTLPTATFDAPPSGTTATATLTVRDGLVVGITITNGGSGYVTPPTITISASDGGGTLATAACVLTRGKIALTITNPGAGYVTAPTITIAAPPQQPVPMPPQIADDTPTAWADGMGWGIIQGGSLTGGLTANQAALIVHDDRSLVAYGLVGEGGNVPTSRNADAILSWYLTLVKLSIQDINADGVLSAWVPMAGGA